MVTSNLRKTAIIILVVLSAPAFTAWAENAKLTDIIVTNTRDDLLAYLKVRGAFRENMENAILSGVPTSFSFLIALYRVRGFWLDQKIADIRVDHTIKYNTLKKEFTVSRSWESGQPKVVDSFTRARELMSEIDSLKIVSLDMLTKGQQYQLRAKAELSKVTLPFYLHYVLFFVSLWDFETDWYTIDFIY